MNRTRSSPPVAKATRVVSIAAITAGCDEVFKPHSPRKRIAMGLRKLYDKELENPWKKHDNIPL